VLKPPAFLLKSIRQPRATLQLRVRQHDSDTRFVQRDLWARWPRRRGDASSQVGLEPSAMMQVGRQKCLPLVFRRDNRGVLVVSWRKIPIALVDKQKGEQTAQAYDIACLRQLSNLDRRERCEAAEGWHALSRFLASEGKTAG